MFNKIAGKMIGKVKTKQYYRCLLAICQMGLSYEHMGASVSVCCPVQCLNTQFDIESCLVLS